MRRRYTETDRELMKRIGQNFKETLKSKGIQQREIAEMTGLSTSAISDYVNGKALMNPGTVQMIADALKVSKGDIDPTYRGTITKETAAPYSAPAASKNDIEKLAEGELYFRGVKLTDEQKEMYLKLTRALFE